jgi:hypothetical protein
MRSLWREEGFVMPSSTMEEFPGVLEVVVIDVDLACLFRYIKLILLLPLGWVPVGLHPALVARLKAELVIGMASFNGASIARSIASVFLSSADRQ